MPQPKVRPLRLHHAGSSGMSQASPTRAHVPKYPPEDDGLDSAVSAPASAATSPIVVPSSISRTPCVPRGAGHRDQGRAPRLEPAGRPVPRVAEPGDEGRVGEALDVLDERRPAPHAVLRDARRRRGRPGVPAVDVVDRRRCLAGHVADRVPSRCASAGGVSVSPLVEGAADQPRPRPRAPSRCRRRSRRRRRPRRPGRPRRSRGAAGSPSGRGPFRCAGSPSAPFATTTARPSLRSASARHLRPTGNPAPPRPSRPLASSSAMRSRVAAGAGKGTQPCHVLRQALRRASQRRTGEEPPGDLVRDQRVPPLGSRVRDRRRRAEPACPIPRRPAGTRRSHLP